MKCHDIRENFSEYLGGTMSPDKKAEIQDHIAECPACRSELEELTALWSKLGVLEEEQPDPGMRTRFYSMLEKHIQESAEQRPTLTERFSLWLNTWWPKRPVRQFALSLTLLLAGLAVGNFFHITEKSASENSQLRGEINEMRRTLAVSLLEKTSASARLHGVNVSSEISQPDESLLTTLLDTMENDPNINVRLAAVDALYLFRQNPLVKEGLVQALSQQDSSLVQAALINLLSDIREQKAIDALKRFLKEREIDPEVRTMAEESIRRMEM